MGIQVKDVIVDDHRVNIAQMPAREAFKYKVRLVKLFGGSVGSLFSGGQVDKNADVSSAFVRLADTLDPDAFLKLALDGLRYTHVNEVNVGTDNGFDQIFSGNMNLVYLVLFETLKFNYSSFFENGGIGKRLGVLTKTASPVPPKSEQFSNESTKN